MTALTYFGLTFVNGTPTSCSSAFESGTAVQDSLSMRIRNIRWVEPTREPTTGQQGAEPAESVPAAE